jgi:hypothetical protein
VTGTNRAEVPMIECGELAFAEALDDRHDRGVHETELEIGMAIEQLAYSHVVGTRQIDDRDRAVCEICEEGEERFGSKSVSDKPVQLDDDRRRYEQLFAEAEKKIGARLMVRVGPIHGCIERSGVADQRHERGS